ncbi:MAG: DUF4062 domain-containing protein [Dehalococcoidia bacterium]|nr:DUF4062 domain-containing protein [Dehalococcoidia bacterium]
MLIFISSVMTDTLAQARTISTQAVESLELGRPWAFEYTPASSEAPSEGYLRKVAEADFVIWLVGSETTVPVVDEINQCLASERRLLVFKLPCSHRDERTERLLERVGAVTKWRNVEDIDQLADHIREALLDEIVRALRQAVHPSRKNRLEELRSLSIASCKASWQALGVPEPVAANLATDTRVGNTLIIPPAGLHIVEGDLGAGKTLAAQRLFQTAAQHATEDSSQSFPVFIKASRLTVPLSDHIAQDCKGYADPYTQGVFVIVDGIDERGLREGNTILQEALAYVGANAQATVVLTTRPLPGLDASVQRSSIPPLSDGQLVELLSNISGVELGEGHIQGWSHFMSDASKNPLLSILFGLKIKDNPEFVYSSRNRLLKELADDFVKQVAESSEELDPLLHAIAIRVTNAGAPVPLVEVDRRRSRQDLVLGSRLITASSGAVDFALPVLREWYAARAILEGTIAIEDLKYKSDRWVAPLAIALDEGDRQFREAALEFLTANDPGLASLVLHELKPSWPYTAEEEAEPPSSLSTPEDAGRQILGALQHWAEGLGVLYETAGPVTETGDTKPLMVGVRGRYVMTLWYEGPEQRPPLASVDVAEALANPPQGWSYRARDVPPSEAWPWIIAKEDLAREMDRALDHGMLARLSEVGVKELCWEIALKLGAVPSNEDSTLRLDEVLQSLSELVFNGTGGVYLNDTEYAVSDLQAIESHLRGLQSSGQLHLHPPWPASGISHGLGPPLSHRDPQDLLLHTNEVFAGALEIYRQVVERGLPHLSPRLRLYSLMPVNIEGHLVTPKGENLVENPPVISWRPRIVPIGQGNTVSLKLKDDQGETVSGEEFFRRETEAYRRIRGDEAGYPRLFSVSARASEFFFEKRPASILALSWLKDELKDLDFSK